MCGFLCKHQDSPALPKKTSCSPCICQQHLKITMRMSRTPDTYHVYVKNTRYLPCVCQEHQILTMCMPRTPDTYHVYAENTRYLPCVCQEHKVLTMLVSRSPYCVCHMHVNLTVRMWRKPGAHRAYIKASLQQISGLWQPLGALHQHSHLLTYQPHICMIRPLYHSINQTISPCTTPSLPPCQNAHNDPMLATPSAVTG